MAFFLFQRGVEEYTRRTVVWFPTQANRKVGWRLGLCVYLWSFFLVHLHIERRLHGLIHGSSAALSNV